MALKRESTQVQDLCLACGFCCNGVIFANVKLQPGDDAARLRSLGLPLRPGANGGFRFPQPCASHDGCRCGIYPDRPVYCREFDCLLLRSVKTGELDPLRALRVIQRAKRQVARVRKLLVSLGETNQQRPLHARFRSVSRRVETVPPGAGEAELYGQLTLAIHELNLLLSERFYSA
jgi:hypothetical protein